MRALLRYIVNFLMLGIVVGCGGGGGGEGELQDARTGVRVIHAALEGVPVDLYVDDDPSLVQSVRFGDIPQYAPVEPGNHLLKIVERHNASVRLSDHSLQVEEGDRFSVLLVRDGREAFLLDDAPPEIESGEAAVRFVHGVEGAGSLAFELSDTSVSAEGEGQASRYAIVPEGERPWVVRHGSDPMSRGRILLEGGRSYTVVLAGEAGYFLVSRILVDR